MIEVRDHDHELGAVRYHCTDCEETSLFWKHAVSYQFEFRMRHSVCSEGFVEITTGEKE